jgi:hypothetical protein
MNPIDAAALLELDDAAFRQRFRHTPLWRPKRRGLLRNAGVGEPSALVLLLVIAGAGVLIQLAFRRRSRPR